MIRSASGYGSYSSPSENSYFPLIFCSVALGTVLALVVLWMWYPRYQLDIVGPWPILMMPTLPATWVFPITYFISSFVCSLIAGMLPIELDPGLPKLDHADINISFVVVLGIYCAFTINEKGIAAIFGGMFFALAIILAVVLWYYVAAVGPLLIGMEAGLTLGNAITRAFRKCFALADTKNHANSLSIISNDTPDKSEY